jgi:hypothetical protein
MKQCIDARCKRPPDQLPIRDLAFDRANAAVIDWRSLQVLVEQNDLVERRRSVCTERQSAAREQTAREHSAEHPTTACDHDSHVMLLAGRSL